MKPIFDPIKEAPPIDTLSGIWAYTNIISVEQGGTIRFCVWIEGNADFNVDIYRQTSDYTGAYIATLSGSSGPQTTNQDPYINGCGWQPNVDYNVPSDLQSGVYLAVLTSSYGATHLRFVVKASHPGQNAKILCVSSVNTWEAYNLWGGKSLYGDDPNWIFENRTYKVSFNRPQRTWDYEQWEIQFIQWLDQNGYLDPANPLVEFCTNVDIHADPTIVNNYNLVLSLGHDEYWSWEMRNTIEDFVSNNGNTAFFSGNVSWWQVRFESQDDWDGNPIPNRLMVCYKDFDIDKDANPSVPDNHITVNWIDKIINRPENLMTGVSYYFGTALWGDFSQNTSFKVKLNKHWLLQGIDPPLNYGDTFGNSLFDRFETDAADFADVDRKFPIPTGKLANDSDDFTAPKDLMVLAYADLSRIGDVVNTLGYWSGPNFHSGAATMGIFRKPSGGFVFHCGNYNWARTGLPLSGWNQFCQITKNILDILGTDYQAQALLLDNPGFENWASGMPVGWDQTGNGLISQAHGYISGSSVLINSATSGDTFLSQSYIPIRTNRNYLISCYAKSLLTTAPVASPGVTISLQVIDQYGTPGAEFVTASYSDWGNWQQISGQGQFSNSENITTQVRVKVLVKGGLSAYFDNVVVQEL
jgi:hypothetical protein